MSFPTTSVLDTFDRADAANLGSAWTGNLWSGEASPAIASNRASASATTSAYWNAQTFGPDCEAYLTWGGGGRFFIDVRATNIGTGTLDGYETNWRTDLGYVQINRIDNEVTTTLSPQIPVGFVSGFGYGVSAIGSTISVWVRYGAAGTQWSLVGSVTDSTYTGAGYIGMEMLTGAAVDDFGGGDVSNTFRFARRLVPQP